MQLQERARMLGHDARHRMRDAKLEKADRERERLRTENELMRERIERTDGELSRALEALDGIVKTDGRAEHRPRKHRVRRLFVLGAAAGTAYLMGAKARGDRRGVARRWWAGMQRRTDSTDTTMVTDAGSPLGAPSDPPIPAAGVTTKPSPDPTRWGR